MMPMVLEKREAGGFRAQGRVLQWFRRVCPRWFLEKFRAFVALMIYGNLKCRVNSHADMMKLVRLIFGLKTFTAKLTRERVMRFRLCLMSPS